MIRVECNLTNCLYHTLIPGDKLCHCTHPDKPHHLIEEVCPLYRADWSKSENQADKLRQRFGIGKKPGGPRG